MPRGEGRPLTPTDVAHHLACEHRTQLERQRHAGTLKVEFRPDARLEALIQRGAEHERRYVDLLRAAGHQITDLRGSRDAADTLAAMRAGADVIVQAPLARDDFTGIADVLLRTPDSPDATRHAYEPVDTKLAVETKAGALLQLLTYCDLLDGMQGHMPDRFFVFTLAAQKPEIYRSADYAAYFRVIREHLRRARAEVPAPPTYPDPVAHCDVCAYWQHCDQRRRADDDPSLIAGIPRSHVQELKRQQLPTLTAFAHAGALPDEPERGRANTYARLAHQARLQLQARTTQRIPVDSLPLEPGRGLLRLPEPTPGDVFLDFEGDSFVGQGGLEYLTGYGHLSDDGTFHCAQIWALDRAAEKQALEQFLDWLVARREQHPALHVYHFGGYEPAALRRLCARHDTRGMVLDEFLRGERFVDLHSVVREAFRIGVERYGLKDLEAVIGHSRQLALRAAGEAKRDLELHLELDRPGSIPEAWKVTVAEYNRDDCRATAHLRDWLEQQRTTAEQQHGKLLRPLAGAPEAEEITREREQRVAALRDALAPVHPLLADLMGYFRRESKSTWWGYFRLRELPEEEYLDEREVIGQLEYLRTLPLEKRQQLPRHVYRFPPQDCSIKRSSELVLLRSEDPAPQGKATSMRIAELDVEAREITLALPGALQGRHPTALVIKPFIPKPEIEDALLSLGDLVRDHGLTAPGHGPALDLLMRRPPRRSSVGPMQVAGEESAEALTRLCRELNGGVLPVQGPPGAGKSHAGARAILELARDGERIGVVAVSHKVIDELLLKLREASTGRPIAALHVDKDPGKEGIPRTNDHKQAFDALDAHTVVGGTMYFWAGLPADKQLDYLFVDEAGQMSLASVLAIARAARNLVLLGDPQQLEQPHKGTHPDGADVAALTHLIGADRATVGEDQGLFLPETWRLHPSICAFTSELYYERRLSPRAGCERQRVNATGVVDGAGMFLLECPHTGNQASSRQEVDAIVALVAAILQPTATWTSRDGTTAPLEPKHILVIAPYNAQVRDLRQHLAPLGVTHVGTVDKFQGQEAPIVIYSCASSSAADAPRGLEFLYDPHRLNVATSRARCVFVMVASPALFAPEVRTPEQMCWANGMCRFREVAKPLRLPDEPATRAKHC